jgi:hypothetical protein
MRMRVINPHAPISNIANARLAEKIVEGSHITRQSIPPDGKPSPLPRSS